MDVACQRCGKPLGRRRARQGLRVHPQCRATALDLESISRALEDVHGVLERLEQRPRVLLEEHDEPRDQEREVGAELDVHVHEAATEAQALIRHLRRYKDFVQGPGSPPRPRERAASHPPKPEVWSVLDVPRRIAEQRVTEPRAPEQREPRAQSESSRSMR